MAARGLVCYGLCDNPADTTGGDRLFCIAGDHTGGYSRCIDHQVPVYPGDPDDPVNACHGLHFTGTWVFNRLSWSEFLSV